MLSPTQFRELVSGRLKGVGPASLRAVLAAAEGFFAGPPHFTRGAWLAVAFIGVNSGVGYYLWLWALNHAPATQVTVFLSLSPLTAAALGAMLLGEPVTLGAVVALVCVALGLRLAVE